MKKDRQSDSTERALQERVKELTCLYDIAQIAAHPEASLDDVMNGIVETLPPAWQYPDIASARISLDGRTYASARFADSPRKQTADIIVSGVRRGAVEVAYSREKPASDEGPFLKEERHLIDAVAQQVALIVERRQAEEDKTKLQAQLMHADRLATIGLLAVGVAHELNEPLGNILGFAQLAKKSDGLPRQAKDDVEKIEKASLHAREIIRKLLTFARQTPTRKQRVNLNEVIDEGLYFFDARCAKSGIELIRAFAPGLPPVTADRAQLNQVLVNLVSNAIYEMPKGGTLKVATREEDGHVLLIVEDTGPGMTAEVQEKIFTPFFTTKEIGQGTGLGLPVVHGIVTAHKGQIKVDSRVGRGTRFEIRLPIDDKGPGDTGDKTT